MSTAISSPPRKHHLDRRAVDVAARGAACDPDDLLSTVETAAWLGLSQQFIEIGRCKGYGPAYLRLSPRRIRYRVGDVLVWLNERAHRGTAEYETGTIGRKTGSRVVDGKVIQPAAEAGDATAE